MFHTVIRDRPFPPGFIAWATTRNHRHFTAQRVSQQFYAFTYAPPMQSRINAQPVSSSFTLTPEQVGPGWRIMVGQLIRDSRRHVQQQYPVRA